MGRLTIDRMGIKSAKKLARSLRERGISQYVVHRKREDHALELSKIVITQQKTVNELLEHTRWVQAVLGVATEKVVVAENRLWSALAVIKDGIAVFDHAGRLVAANTIWLEAFDGVTDVAPGATYETILRVAVDEGLIDLQEEDAHAWLAGMIARWEEHHIAPKDIRLFNGTHVRLIDKRTPQGDIVSMCINTTYQMRRKHAPKRVHDAAKAKTTAPPMDCANDVCKSSHRPSAAYASHKHVRILTPPKSNMANLITAIGTGRAKPECTTGDHHVTTERVNCGGALPRQGGLTEIVVDTKVRGETAHSVPLVLLPQQRVLESVARRGPFTYVDKHSWNNR